MAKLLKVPTSLPCADLYLDDLQTIQEFVSESAAIDPANGAVTFVYELGDSEVYYSIEDLQEHGGSVSEFSIKVSTAGGIALYFIRFRKRNRPYLDVPSRLRRDEWALSAKLLQLFAARKNTIRDFMQGSEGHIPTLIFVVAVYALGIVLLNAITFFQLGHSSTIFGAWRFALVTFSALLPFVYGQIRPNRVHLSFSRAVAADALRRRQNRNSQLIIGSVSGVIGAVVGGLLVFYIQWKLKWHF